MAILTVERLSVSYPSEEGWVRAADEVSFTLEGGEIFALVGGSGSGKTSVALALTKLLPPTARIEGRVLMEGVNLLEMLPTELRKIRGSRISYIFQDPASSLNPVLTIGSQLIEAIEWHTPKRSAQAYATAVDWLKRVGIPSPESRMSSYPHELSGGMQQRVMIAMALSTGPSLLIADEPTTALDVTTQVKVLRLLRDLQRALNLCILFITHDLSIVERFGQRVGIMAEGRLVETGSVGLLFQNPTHAATQNLLRCYSLLSLPKRES
ncbi:MAG: ABC transporter ATP-binding protein [Candidatus Omnitrophica bacterium]|nr:ABC transporter ATP-binding protein [Candidatus Omnitrophota bacterium]